jgi:hypothetical protein
MVGSEEFFTVGQGSIPMRALLGATGHLEVVVERVVVVELMDDTTEAKVYQDVSLSFSFYV